MKILDALIITGRLQVQLKNQPKSLLELRIMQDYLVEGKYANAAISYGKLSEYAKTYEKYEEISSDMENLYNCLLSESNDLEMLNIPIKQIGVDSTTYNAFARADISTIADFLDYHKKNSPKPWNGLGCIGEVRYCKVLDAIKKLGIQLD